MKTINVGKMCKISEFNDNDSEYILDVIALEETDYGFMNFQFGASLNQNCCESNALDSIDYYFDEVEERISSRWGIDYKEQINVTKKVVDYIEFETSDDLEEEDDEDRYNVGGWIKISVVLDDGQKLIAEYSNYHNGYYAHGVSVFENGDVIYDGVF